VGIAARGAASSFPDAPGMLEVDTSVKNAFADSARAADAQKTFHRPAPAKNDL
jgi:hypothetical protein